MQHNNLSMQDTPLTFLDLMEVLNQWMEPMRQMQEVLTQTKDPKTAEQALSRYKTSKRIVADKCHAVSREAWLQLDNLGSIETTTYDEQGRVKKDIPTSHKRYITIFSNLSDLVRLDILSKSAHAERLDAYKAWAGVMKLLHEENNYFGTLAILTALANNLFDFSSILQADLPQNLSDFIRNLQNKRYGNPVHDMPAYTAHIARKEFFIPHFAVYKQALAALDGKAFVVGKEKVAENVSDSFGVELLKNLTAVKASLKETSPNKKLSLVEQVVFNRPLLNKDDLDKLLALARWKDFQETLARLHLTSLQLKEHYKNKPEKLAMVIDLAQFIAVLRADIATITTDAKSIANLHLKLSESFNKLNEKRFFPIFQCKEDKLKMFGKRVYKNKLPNLFKNSLTLCERFRNCLNVLTDLEIQDPTKACVLQPVRRGSKVMPRTNSSLALTGSFGDVVSSPSTATLRPAKGNKP